MTISSGPSSQSKFISLFARESDGTGQSQRNQIFSARWIRNSSGGRGKFFLDFRDENEAIWQLRNVFVMNLFSEWIRGQFISLSIKTKLFRLLGSDPEWKPTGG